jgi:AcrR family transcriptional regulator
MPPGRRTQLLRIAAKMMSERGYNAVGMDDIGEAAGISGPALYRHFRSKQHLLGELLMEPFELLNGGAKRIVAQDLPARTTLERLVDWHIEATSKDVDVIRVYYLYVDETLDEDRAPLDAAFNEYIGLWIAPLRQLRPDLTRATLYSAVMGLLRLFIVPYDDRRRHRQDALIASMAKSAIAGVLDLPATVRSAPRISRAVAQEGVSAN